MSSIIGKVSSLDGEFYVRDSDGSLREVSQGDEIYEGEVIVGSSNNSSINSIIVTLDNGTDIITLADESQLFDGSLFDEAFSENDTVSSVESIEAMFDDSESSSLINKIENKILEARNKNDIVLIKTLEKSKNIILDDLVYLYKTAGVPVLKFKRTTSTTRPKNDT